MPGAGSKGQSGNRKTAPKISREDHEAIIKEHKATIKSYTEKITLLESRLTIADNKAKSSLKQRETDGKEIRKLQNEVAKLQAKLIELQQLDSAKEPSGQLRQDFQNLHDTVSDSLRKFQSDKLSFDDQRFLLELPARLDREARIIREGAG